MPPEVVPFSAKKLQHGKPGRDKPLIVATCHCQTRCPCTDNLAECSSLHVLPQLLCGECMHLLTGLPCQEGQMAGRLLSCHRARCAALWSCHITRQVSYCKSPVLHTLPYDSSTACQPSFTLGKASLSANAYTPHTRAAAKHANV